MLVWIACINNIFRCVVIVEIGLQELLPSSNVTIDILPGGRRTVG